MDLIKKIIDGDVTLENLNKITITKEELTWILDYYKEILLLKKSCVNDSEMKIINQKLKRINVILNLIYSGIYTISTNNTQVNTRKEFNIYSNNSVNAIDNVELFLEVILSMANQNEKKYHLGIFSANDVELESREDNIPTIYAISNKEILDSIDNTIDYPRRNFTKVADRILSSGNSLILVTKNGFNTIIEPSRNRENLISFYLITSYGNSNIFCYLYNDELSHALEKFVNFANEYGWSIKKYDKKQLITKIEEYNKTKINKLR